jgi:hypothetical protein
MFKQFRYPTNRQALVAAIASAMLLITLVVLWLATSTRTAVLNYQLETLDERQVQVDEEINAIWTQMGEVTSAQVMERRIRDAGFAPAEGMEFLVQATATAMVSPTVSMTSTDGTEPSVPAREGSQTLSAGGGGR